MTPEELVMEADKLCEAASDIGKQPYYGFGGDDEDDWYLTIDGRAATDVFRGPDAAFIARSRTLIPELTQALKGALAERETVRNIVGTDSEWDIRIHGWAQARTSLRALIEAKHQGVSE